MVAESGVMASSSDDEEFSVSPSIADLNDILDSLPAFTGHTHTHTHTVCHRPAIAVTHKISSGTMQDEPTAAHYPYNLNSTGAASS